VTHPLLSVRGASPIYIVHYYSLLGSSDFVEHFLGFRMLSTKLFTNGKLWSNYGKAKLHGINKYMKSSRLSPVQEQKYMAKFDRCWGRTRMMCVRFGRFVKWQHNEPRLKEVSLVESFLECLVTLPCVGVVLPSLGNESLDLRQTK
jgi:hypothetical protein